MPEEEPDKRDVEFQTAMEDLRQSVSQYVSMSDGVSRHSINDRIVDKLEHMMDESGSEYERSVISGWIEKIGSN